jgi:hypothetical protein
MMKGRKRKNRRVAGLKYDGKQTRNEGEGKQRRKEEEKREEEIGIIEKV